MEVNSPAPLAKIVCTSSLIIFSQVHFSEKLANSAIVIVANRVESECEGVNLYRALASPKCLLYILSSYYNYIQL